MLAAGVPCRVVLRRVKRPSAFENLSNRRLHSRRALRPSFADRLPSENVRAQGRPGGRMHPGLPRKNELRERENHRYRR
jgi:hypothetical protein